MTEWIAETLFETTLLMALVLLLRHPVRQAFGAKAAYLLWLAPLLRLIVPPLPIAVPDVSYYLETSAGGALPAAIASTPSGSTFFAALIAIWLAGATIFLVTHIARYQQFLRHALSSARPVAEPAIADAAVLESATVSGPAATGLIVRRIFVPDNFADRFAPEQRTLALAHEALHHRRGDLWASAAALIVLALHWWNPLAYLAHRAFRSDLEAACDADLIAQIGDGQRHAYAQTLLRCIAPPFINTPTPHPSCCLTNLSELKGRLNMLKLNHNSTRRLAGLLIATGVASSGLFLALPAVAQEQPAAGKAQTERVQIRRIVKDGKVVEESNITPEMRARMEQCEGEKFEMTGGTPTDKKRTLIKLCMKPGTNKAEAADRLEKLVAEMQASSELPAEQKAEMIARIKARIAELRAGG
jgi:bla regulator protein BlaR1